LTPVENIVLEIGEDSFQLISLVAPTPQVKLVDSRSPPPFS
jgi:hypothetical protein